MRNKFDFYLDHDVPEETRSALHKAGHNCRTSAEVGRDEAADTEQVIYAQEKRLVFVTFDRELVHSRRSQPIGRVIRLQCSEFNACELLLDAITCDVDDITEVLARKTDVMVRVSRRSTGEVNVRYTHGNET